MGNYIVVPDTHGHLRQAEACVKFFRRQGYLHDHTLVFLGDYVDRGPKVRELVQYCAHLQKEGHRFIAGNHEYTLARALAGNPDWILRWACNYEEGMLASFGILPPSYKRLKIEEWRRVAEELGEALTREERGFLCSLPPFYEDGELLCIHAGVEPDVPWKKQKKRLENTKIWKKSKQGPNQIFSGKLGRMRTHVLPHTVVSGHVVLKKPVICPRRVQLHCGVERGGPLAVWVSSTKEIFYFN